MMNKRKIIRYQRIFLLRWLSIKNHNKSKKPADAKHCCMCDGRGEEGCEKRTYRDAFASKSHKKSTNKIEKRFRIIQNLFLKRDNLQKRSAAKVPKALNSCGLMIFFIARKYQVADLITSDPTLLFLTQIFIQSDPTF